MLFLLILGFTDLSPGNPAVTRMAAIMAWVAIWWLTEAIPLGASSLLPFVLIPLLGIAPVKTIAAQYMDPVIFLFIGGFLISFAIEKHGLHRRISLRILSAVGRSPGMILLGVMLTAFVLSMWMSNTATVMMLISAVTGLIDQLSDHLQNEQQRKKFATAVLLGLAYAATCGGMATLVGTPPNMVFYRSYLETYPLAGDMDFVKWFVRGFPAALLMAATAYFIIRFLFIRGFSKFRLKRSEFAGLRRQLGRMSRNETLVAVIFIATVILWFTRDSIEAGNFRFTGWAELLNLGDMVQDSTVAVAMAILLFLIPAQGNGGERLLEWEDAQRLPFHIILLFGSGFALADGFRISGLSHWLAQQLQGLQGVPVWLVILGIVATVTLISEFASNVASIQLTLPVLVSLQEVLQVHPLVLMVPATLAASLGFMLPVATAPNTIVYGTGQIRTGEMMKAGFILDLAGIAIISLLTYFYF